MPLQLYEKSHEVVIVPPILFDSQDSECDDEPHALGSVKVLKIVSVIASDERSQPTILGDVPSSSPQPPLQGAVDDSLKDQQDKSLPDLPRVKPEQESPPVKRRKL